MAFILFTITRLYANERGTPRALPRLAISETNFNVPDIYYALILAFCLLQFSIGLVIFNEFTLRAFNFFHLRFLRFKQLFIRSELLKFYITLFPIILKFVPLTIFETNFPWLRSTMHHPLFLHFLILFFFLIVSPIQDV